MEQHSLQPKPDGLESFSVCGLHVHVPSMSFPPPTATLRSSSSSSPSPSQSSVEAGTAQSVWQQRNFRQSELLETRTKICTNKELLLRQEYNHRNEQQPTTTDHGRQHTHTHKQHHHNTMIAQYRNNCSARHGYRGLVVGLPVPVVCCTGTAPGCLQKGPLKKKVNCASESQAFASLAGESL